MKMPALLLLTLLSAPAHSGTDVIELFRADSPADLEAAISDGYPMPWLAEILADSTISEEDRYWLDCRMRAAIARDLHVFFDREGHRVRVEAEWIGPGEFYWQENMMVDGPAPNFGRGEVPESMPASVAGEPGAVLNLYGEHVADLAVVNPDVRLSRDASLGTIPSGPTAFGNVPPLPDRRCFLYPDGSFLEVPTRGYRTDWYAVSPDGSRAAFCDYWPGETPDGSLTLYTRNGAVISETEIGFGSQLPPVFSHDSRLVAMSTMRDSFSIVLLDADNGALLRRFNMIWSNSIAFSLDDDQLFFTSVYTGTELIGGLGYIDLEGPPDTWRLVHLLPACDPWTPQWVSEGSTSELIAVTSCSTSRESFELQRLFFADLYDAASVVHLMEMEPAGGFTNEIQTDVSPDQVFYFVETEHLSLPVLTEEYVLIVGRINR